MSKICRICQETKNIEDFVKNRYTCKPCANANRREKNKEKKEELKLQRQAYYEKTKDKRNENRRSRYDTDQGHREKAIQNASIYKKKKTLQRQKLREEEQLRIGLDNKKCRYCNQIKHKDRFRYNRLKCRDCERDDPLDKLKRVWRSRVYTCLKRKKSKHFIGYLGCSSEEYLAWLLTHNSEYTLDNHGKIWHIDHVIPVSKFNIDNIDSQMKAFNWRNTMPLSAKENLAKNNKIIVEQIQAHLDNLTEYHKKRNIEFPQEFIDLFARYLDAGNPLESQTTTSE